MSLVDRLAEIREQAGYAPLPDPGVIDGPPMPIPSLDENPDEDQYDLLPDPEPTRVIEEQEWVQNHPVNYSRPEPTPEPAPKESVEATEGSFFKFLDKFSLIIHDRAAMYKSRAVELNDKENAAVVRIILGADQRVLNELTAEVVPKRQRRKKADSRLVPSIDLLPDGTGRPHVAAESLAEVGDVQKGPSPPPPPNLVSPPKKRGRPRKVRQHLDGTET